MRKFPANLTHVALALVETNANSHTKGQMRNPVANA